MEKSKTKVTVEFFKTNYPHRFYMKEVFYTSTEPFEKQKITEEMIDKFPNGFYNTIEVSKGSAWDKWLINILNN